MNVIHIYLLCILFFPWFLGFGPEGGRSPVEHRGNLYVRTYVRTYVPSPRWPGLALGRPGLALGRPGLALGRLGLALGRSGLALGRPG